MTANGMTEEEAADNWELPLEAIREAIAYCDHNKELIAMEADEERAQLQSMGVDLALRD
ncbi:MAG: hypothetical protein P4L46_04125 [Fimbriimonas sp.]|nr:hypothetical protein [Fimbriimonas sp.]